MSAPRLHPWPRGAVAAVAAGATQPPDPPARDPRSASLPAHPTAQTLAATLLREGLVAHHAMVQALALQRKHSGRLADILIARRMIAEADLFAALARHWQAGVIDPERQPPDPRLIDRLGAATCLRDGLLPWRQAGAVTVIATAFPEDFARRRSDLEDRFGPVLMALVPGGALEAAILAARGAALDHAATCRVAAAESCRDWGNGAARPWLGLIALALLAGLFAAPLAVVSMLTLWALVTLTFATLLKIAAAFSALRRPAPEPPPALIARLPIVSVVVALYHESTIAVRLIRRLERCDYPRELLDIVLVVEACDTMTRSALGATVLPPWMRVVVAPEGHLKTKPRALNFALDACRGQIIGVYDAEDAPAPDQIRRVVARFYQRGADVACLQGVLDFYNPSTNWLSRCFTLDYAAWFRIILPGLARLGFAIPLGGTTLFFRRTALDALGGWDAHNVTEDADLGMRLARHGYRTELIDTVTEEEANCQILPWIRQRSRWLKGYMVTYAVHMRDPALLWRQLGAWKFLGFQVFFLTTLSQFLLAPVLWSFWLLAIGLPHPVADALPAVWHLALMGLFLVTESVLLVVTLVALRLTPARINPLWALMMHLYFPLGAVASYKAAWELIRRPFFWDKTRHGLFDPLE